LQQCVRQQTRGGLTAQVGAREVAGEARGPGKGGWREARFVVRRSARSTVAAGRRRKGSAGMDAGDHVRQVHTTKPVLEIHLYNNILMEQAQPAIRLGRRVPVMPIFCRKVETPKKAIAKVPACLV